MEANLKQMAENERAEGVLKLRLLITAELPLTQELNV